MQLLGCRDLDWLDRAHEARVEVWLGDFPHHLELWPGWDTGRLQALDRDLLYTLLAGALRWDAGRGWETVQAPCCLWFPAGSSVRVACVPGAELPTVRRLRWRLVVGRRQLGLTGGPRRRDDLGPAPALMERLVRERERDDPVARHRRRALAIALACHWFEPADAPTRDPWAQRFADLEREVQRQLRSDGALPTPADLARWYDRSPDYFTRRFRRHFGLSPRIWLSHQRLAEAARRLQASDLDVAAIAAELGFDDPRVFNRAFRERYGQPPGRWRRDTGGLL